MTTVTFHRTHGQLCGFAAEGHSGYAPAGGDIVCAAISAAVGLVECTVNQVLGLAAPITACQRDGRLALRLPGGLEPAHEATCQALLTGLMVYLESLAGEYPKHLAVRLDDSDESGARPSHSL
ncbi:MAG TPA: ribosomal-processing cysteine protease Prp [Candidatus Enterenecus merdae]|nr:ribosomal-processing cysteine protease Prp [Candidatus Enterenecus merdae]